MAEGKQNNATLGVLFILFGTLAISINDMLIKHLSGAYPLHEIVFIRALIGLLLSLFIVRMEGGWQILKTNHPWQHALRGLLIVVANMTYFAALATMPLADATALFFAAPLFITVLSIPLLGEKVGVVRMTAVLVGFMGVVLMQRPWADSETLGIARWVLLLPVVAAMTYALNQLMTRKLGIKSKASALSVYIHLSFVVVSLGFFIVAGDGRFAQGQENPALVFLFRAWVWPESQDIWVMLGMGANAAVVGYCLSQAYRIADAATVAPFEYVGLPLAVFWGWAIFGDLPMWEVWAGITLILGSGLFVFVRERQKSRKITRPVAEPR